MEASIPFCDGFSLGRAIDVTKCPFEQGPFLIPDNIKPDIEKVNVPVPKFCVIRSIEDVCNVLQIPLAYLLKVQADLINDSVVRACMKSADDPNTNICTIFHLVYRQQKQYLPREIGLNLSALNLSSDGSHAQSASEDITKDTETHESVSSATHWIKALELGNELIVICRISSPRKAQIASILEKLTKQLGGFTGRLESRQISGLQNFARKMDKKMREADNNHINLQIEYCTHGDLPSVPPNLTGMLDVLRDFLWKCEKWVDIFWTKDLSQLIFNKEPMICRNGNHMPQEKDFGKGKQQQYPLNFCSDPAILLAVSTLDDCSFEALPPASDSTNYLRAIIQSFRNDDAVVNSVHRVQYHEQQQSKLLSLRKIFLRNSTTTDNFKRFMESFSFINEDQKKEAESLAKDLFNAHIAVVKTIEGLNLITVPTDEQLRLLFDSDASQNMDQFIERVTSKLPPGLDLDLLLIGKTGHGKSSTGNSILGQTKFEESASGESVTAMCKVGWTNVDGRAIKVVDTPGVCDTRSSTDQSSMDMAAHAISDAIARCPNGFHALLLVIRYGQRMTMEEKKAIAMLKALLGEDIIQKHCVCVVTYGDCFKRDMIEETETKNFDAWCRSQKGFLKEVFEECQYRCVLFDNRCKDLKLRKRQLIELVAHIDGLSSKGTRYTSDLFDFARRETQKVIAEENVPEADEKVIRDFQIVLEYLDMMIKGSDEIKTFQSDLENLKRAVNSLQNQVRDVKGEGVEKLWDTTVALHRAVRYKMDQLSKTSRKEKKAVPDTSNDRPQSDAQNGAHSEFTRNLQPLRRDLVICKDEIGAKSQKVNEKVSREIQRKIKRDKNCFPGLSWVISKDGSHRRMRDLNIGDEVLVRKENGQLALEEVYMFGHHDKETVGDFLVFETYHQKIFASVDHLVYCFKNGLEICLPARFVREDDKLIFFSEKTLVKQKIIKIGAEKHSGVFAPFTFSGTLIVNGALMSCYVDVLPPAKAHKLLKPIRKLYQISPLALEFINGSKRGTAIPSWAKLFLRLKKHL